MAERVTLLAHQRAIPFESMWWNSKHAPSCLQIMPAPSVQLLLTPPFISGLHSFSLENSASRRAIYLKYWISSPNSTSRINRGIICCAAPFPAARNAISREASRRALVSLRRPYHRVDIEHCAPAGGKWLMALVMTLIFNRDSFITLISRCFISRHQYLFINYLDQILMFLRINSRLKCLSTRVATASFVPRLITVMLAEPSCLRVFMSIIHAHAVFLNISFLLWLSRAIYFISYSKNCQHVKFYAGSSISFHVYLKYILMHFIRDTIKWCRYCQIKHWPLTDIISRVFIISDGFLEKLFHLHRYLHIGAINESMMLWRDTSPR